MARKKVAVVLSGCGFKDGSEIHESVLTLLALDRADIEMTCVAPNIPQRRVTNHLNGEETAERRNVLVEAARIARGRIHDLAELKLEEVDGIALPGGFGAALNLSSFAVDGPNCSIHPEVNRVLTQAHHAGKPILAICIAPATVARALGKAHIRVTIGNDVDTAAAIQQTGARHENCPVDACVVDTDNKIVTTPAYMLGERISQVAVGIDAAVEAFVGLL